MHTIEIVFIFFFFNDTATTEIYTLSLHDALPISLGGQPPLQVRGMAVPGAGLLASGLLGDGLGGVGRVGRGREIGRAHVLNSSHANISYAVFCLKKKNQLCVGRATEVAELHSRPL